MPVVDEIAEISPICSTIVAREIGTIVIIDVINNELSNPFPKMEIRLNLYNRDANPCSFLNS